MLNKVTEIYAINGAIPLECDIYTADSTPDDAPVFLFFHAGGLVCFGRDAIPPWLVQVCYTRKWPLISPSYRLLPQSGSDGLLEDAASAYAYAQNWDVSGGTERRVIVGGASGGKPLPDFMKPFYFDQATNYCFSFPGSFMASAIANRLKPTPLALFSISGINTFHHTFFNSSTLLTPEPIPDSDVAAVLSGPAIVGRSLPGDQKTFAVSKLLPSGDRNPDYKPEDDDEPLIKGEEAFWDKRGTLYDYYIHRNLWTELVGDLDPAFGTVAFTAEKKAAWPPTIVFHGNEDYDVPLGVNELMRDAVGSHKVSLFVADGQPHLYEATRFVEDEDACMDAVREAVARLDEIVTKSD
jgi:acetyl esterase/lipase